MVDWKTMAVWTNSMKRIPQGKKHQLKDHPINFFQKMRRREAPDEKSRPTQFVNLVKTGVDDPIDASNPFHQEEEKVSRSERLKLSQKGSSSMILQRRKSVEAHTEDMMKIHQQQINRSILLNLKHSLENKQVA